MENNRKPVIIDCDTGIDDATALIIACASSKLDIRAVTTVAGNTPLENAFRNTKNTLRYLGFDHLPVGKGADKPLFRELFDASEIHGADGLGGYQFPFETDNSPCLSAVELITKTLEESDSPISILVLGPMTNIATLLLYRPDLKAKIKEIVFMGVAPQDTLVRTFNIFVDPEAFDICLNSGIPFYAIGRFLTLSSGYITQSELETLRDIGGPAAEFSLGVFENFNDFFYEDGVKKIPMFDGLTTAFLIAPELFTFKKYYCEVETEDSDKYGLTYLDFNNLREKTEDEKQLYFVETADREKFVSMFIESCSAFNVDP